MTRIGLLLASLALSGCISVGSPFTREQVQRVDLGMTADQVTAIMGAPYQMLAHPSVDGSAMREMWTYVESSGLGQVKQAMVVFENGRVVQVGGAGVAKSMSARTGEATPSSGQ